MTKLSKLQRDLLIYMMVSGGYWKGSRAYAVSLPGMRGYGRLQHSFTASLSRSLRRLEERGLVKTQMAVEMRFFNNQVFEDYLVREKILTDEGWETAAELFDPAEWKVPTGWTPASGQGFEEYTDNQKRLSQRKDNR